MDDFLVGTIILVLGAAVCFFGLWAWFIMLPIWGFIAGFFVGATGVTAIFGDGFLSTVTGWVVGLLVGLLFAAASYLFWYVGALLIAGSVGAALGSGLMEAFGVDAEWVIFIAALGGAALFVFVSFVIALPIYVVVVNTAFVGAIGAVTGAMLLLNRIDLEELDLGPAIALIQESWFWAVTMVILAIMGIIVQLGTMSRAKLPEERWTRGDPSYAV